MLTPEGFTKLEQLIERARQGDLGAGVKGASFHFSFKGLTSEGAVRVELVREDGERVGVALLRPPRPRQESPRHFELFPDDTVTASEIVGLSAVLDELFVSDPWVGRTGLPEEGLWKPFSRRRVLLGAFFVAASTAAGLLFLVFPFATLVQKEPSGVRRISSMKEK